MVEFIANWLANDIGVLPLILTRGYGGADEAKMLQRHFDGTSVKIGEGANRSATAKSFFDRYGFIYPLDIAFFKKQIPGVSDTIGVAILDDGMQHISMSRNLELVMVNALSPWGNRHLLPFGPLREPLTSFSRAHAAIIHHADLVSDGSLSVIKSTILEANQFLPIFLSTMTPTHFFKPPSVSVPLPLGVVSQKIVLCVSAIGSPDSLVQRIQKDIKVMKARLELLKNKFGSDPAIVVTEKDYDRDSEILGELEPFEVLVLCCKLKILGHNGCTEDEFKKLLIRCLS